MKEADKMEALFVGSMHPVSKRTATVEETEFCAWLYLSKKNSNELEKDAWLYNLIEAPERSEISNYRGAAPPVAQDYVFLPGTVGMVKEQNIEFRWSDDGEAVGVWIFGELHAFITPNFKRGFSRLLKRESPWGNPIDFEQYDKHLKS